MLEDDKYTINDLISSASDQKPTDFDGAFQALMLDRITDVVANRKQEIAQSMFNNVGATEPEEE